MPIKPTIKQQMLAQILLADTSKTKKDAMIQAGYSPKTAIVPSQTIDSVGFQQILKKYIPDNLAIKTHKSLLKKKEYIKQYNHASGEYELVKTNQPHGDANKALELWYKASGNFAPEKHLNLNASLSDALDALDQYEASRQENKAKADNITPQAS